MNAETDLITLYSGQILSLASDIPRLGTLEDATGTARRRSPLCGSTVSVDVVYRDGQIQDFTQDVKACALGQAAASIVGRVAIGLTRQDIQTGRDQLKAMLSADGPSPDPPFQDLIVLSPAREYANRHASILLALETLLDAIDASNP